MRRSLMVLVGAFAGAVGSLVTSAPGVAAARPQPAAPPWPCTKASECPPEAGSWAPAGSAPVAYTDPTGYSVAWVNSRVHDPGKGNIPAWFTVTVEYTNSGSSPAGFSCPGVTDPDLAREWFYRGGKVIGYVPATKTSCTENPGMEFTLQPGQRIRLWAKFHNVPWQGDRISIDWTIVRSDLGRRLQTPYVDPYAKRLPNQGRACLFQSPDNTTFAFRHGHVAWAYLSDTNSDTWSVGANEGPERGRLGDRSKTWRARGAWPVALKLIDDGTGGYRSYRCVTVTAPDAGAAWKQAGSEQRAPYWVPNSDCLSHAVNVLRRYGAPLEWHRDRYLPSPNFYYDNLRGWEASATIG